MNTPQLEPLVGTKPSSDPRARDFALFVDGKRVNAERHVEVKPDGISILVAFQTSIGALDDPAVDPIEEAAWAGWKAGDSCHLRQPSNGKANPTNGFVQILKVVLPKHAGEEAAFQVKAITPIYDYVADVEICEGGEFAQIPASWFQK